MVRSEGNMSLKTPVTPPGTDPGTVRLVGEITDPAFIYFKVGETEQNLALLYTCAALLQLDL
jgi:hypothetical protein